MKRILITDIQFRKAFDIVSILQTAFPKESFILGVNEQMGRLKACLCYGKREFERVRTESLKMLTEDLLVISEKYAGDEIIYIPVEERTTDFFIEIIEEKGQRNFRYLLPSAELYHRFRNKEALNRYCLEAGFPAPELYEVEELERAVYPILLKPVIGSGSHGIMRLIAAEQLTDEVRAQLQKERYVAQELIPNGRDVHGAFFLCHEGKVVGAYTHQRIRTSPEEGGVTVLSCMTLEEALIRQGTKLLESVRWEGVVMLEYLYDERTKTYKVIEANPRLWGSVMLSEYGGAFLLTNYVRIMLEMPIREPQVYTGAKIRWLFPMDLLNYVKKKGQMKGFWNMEKTCFITWSYARWDRALWNMVFSILSKENINKLLKRV